MIVSITGRRQFNFDSLPLIEHEIASLMFATKILFGGALGIDTVTLKLANKLLPNSVELVVVFPDKFNPLQFPDTRASYIELGNEITSKDYFASFHKRNQYLVDNCDLLVAFWDGIKKGGTYSAMKYAKKVNREVKIVNI
jgi:uncharacterized phage-like protein YoqJ